MKLDAVIVPNDPSSTGHRHADVVSVPVPCDDEYTHRCRLSLGPAATAHEYCSSPHSERFRYDVQSTAARRRPAAQPLRTSIAGRGLPVVQLLLTRIAARSLEPFNHCSHVLLASLLTTSTLIAGTPLFFELFDYRSLVSQGDVLARCSPRPAGLLGHVAEPPNYYTQISLLDFPSLSSTASEY
jgi:hypothetical protein